MSSQLTVNSLDVDMVDASQDTLVAEEDSDYNYDETDVDALKQVLNNLIASSW